MTKKEFCDRIGIHCSDACFEKYNELYMESDLDKDAFCKTIKVNDIAWEMQWEIIELKKQLATMERQLDSYKSRHTVLIERNVDLSFENNLLIRKLNKLEAIINQ